MLSCRQATELMSQALDRPLRLRERVALQWHKVICLGCRNVDVQLVSLRDISRSWRETWATPDQGHVSSEKEK